MSGWVSDYKSCCCWRLYE